MSNEDRNWFTSDVATFGDRLTAAREATGMDQGKLARRVGVKTSTVRKWEEDLAEPRANRLSMLAGILGVSITWLITGAGEGVDERSEEELDRDAEAAEVLVELRELRTAFNAKAEQVGRIEKRLRRYLREKEPS